MYERPDTRDRDFERLIRGSYGVAPPPRRRRRRGPTVSVAADTGTVVLPQPGRPAEDVQEYVVEREPVPVPAQMPAPAPTPPVAAPQPSPAPPPSQAPAPEPAPEPGRLPDPTPAPAPPQAPAPTPTPAPAPAPPNVLTLPETPPSAAPAAPAPAPAPVALPAALASSPLTSADLAADMQAILSGGAVPAAHAESAPSPAPTTPVGPAPGRPLPEAENKHAVFDEIAKSLEYSNSFDLGTVELQRRFDHFDRLDESGRAPVRTEPVSRPQSTRAETVPPEVQAEMQAEAFSRSLPPGVLGRLPLVDGCVTGTSALPGTPAHSVPMYDTGEHVLAGGDLYPDQLVVNGVPFSYGQLLAMGDLYDTAADLKAANAAELRGLKTLILQDTAHYRGDPGVKDVGHGQWNTATGGRYLTLADENYAHFSPPSVLGMADATSKPDNKSAWEQYHEQAIEEMRELVAAHPNASVAPFGPLTTNAFGDHFLTDAFAAGHLVNKEVVMDRVRRSFYSSGNSLSSAGTAFLGRLAGACWRRQKIRDVFSPLEQYEAILGIKRLNFDTENMFRRLLVGIAEEAPSKVLNLPLKALHDHLNVVGVMVENDAGDTPWLLKGDGHLGSSQTLPVMRRAVKQSVDNILSPEILVSHADQGPQSGSVHSAQLAKVWKHVPRPTSAGRAQVIAAMTTYTDLNSSTLLNAAAAIIEKQAVFLANELRARKVLVHEDGDHVWNDTTGRYEPRR